MDVDAIDTVIPVGQLSLINTCKSAELLDVPEPAVNPDPMTVIVAPDLTISGSELPFAVG